jgi:ankyrin
MVDARGGAMKGCRHSGVRVIIPPKRASMPTRITCRFVRKEKLSLAPPLNESEALAARVLEMGPQGYKFLGPVVLEIPHYASLRGKEREIIILRNDSGDKWYEHPLVATESAIEEALGCTLELAATNAVAAASNEDAQSNGHAANEDNLSQSSSKLRITRIITNDFPKYFALVSRVRHETHAVSEVGGVISSTIVPKAQAVFPEKALQKKIKISLQAMPIPYELVAKMFGNRVAVSPIVTIEPRRRKFHKAITLTIPLPKSPLKGMINNYSHNNESFSLRLLCSITGGLAPAQWEDITGHTPLSYVEECVSFTTTVSARFWLMDCQQVSEATKMATELYREAISVPYMARFIVYAKRHDLNEAKLRVYCITDDKEEKQLEARESFHTVAKSKEVEVLGDRVQWLEMGGNISPVTNKSSGEQLSMLFTAFYENRLPFTVRIRDLDQSAAAGRLVFLKDAKNAPLKSDLRSAPVCTLDIHLPGYDREALEHDEMRKKTTLERGGGLQFSLLNGSGTLSSGARSTNALCASSSSAPRQVEFNLRLLSNDLNNSERPFDWTQLAQRLQLSTDEIDTIKHTSLSSANVFHISPANQTYDMLNHWINKFNNNLDLNGQYVSSGEILLNALKDMNVEEDIITRNISSSFISNQTAVAPNSQQLDNILSVEKSLAKLGLSLNGMFNHLLK